MSLLIDGTIMVLLIGALCYAYLVDMRVRRLVAALRDLAPMIEEFSEAVDKSESSASAIKHATHALQTQSERQAERKAAPAEPVRRKPVAKRKPSTNADGMVPVVGKSDLVRGFFDTVRSREA